MDVSLSISVFYELFPIRREPGNDRSLGLGIPDTLYRGLNFVRRVLASIGYVWRG